MRLTTRARYGVRLMVDLARHYGQGYIFLSDIARRQGISEKYLGNIVSVLKASGMVSACRGVHGGYSRAKQPAKISLKDIVRVLEKQSHLTGCVQKRSSCPRSNFCEVRRIWLQVEKYFYLSLASVSLQDVKRKCRVKPAINLKER